MDENKDTMKSHRPWGWYINLEGTDTSGFKVKRIQVNPGARLSLQSHNHRSEHWVILAEKAKVQLNDSINFLSPNEYVYITAKAMHRIENIGNDPLEFIETQIGNYLGEDDIIRYQDDYGRN